MNWTLIYYSVGGLAAIVFLWLMTKIFKRKPKYDMANLKKLVYETGLKQKEAYEGIQKLEKFFKEVEG